MSIKLIAQSLVPSFVLLMGLSISASAQFANNFIIKGDFEGSGCDKQSCSPWQFSGNSGVSTVSCSGIKSVQVGGLGPGAGSIFQRFTAEKGSYYDVYFSYRSSSGNAGETAAIVTVSDKTIFATMLRFWEDSSCKYFGSRVRIDTDGDVKVEFRAENAPNYAGPLFIVDEIGVVKVH